MAFKKLHLTVAVLGIVVAGAAAWWWQQRPASSAAVAAAVPEARPAGAGAGPGAPGGPNGAAPSGPVPVEVGRVEAVRLEDDVQAVGSVRARQGVMLRPEVSGRIERLNFTDGQPVRRGQVVVQLDDALQAAQLQQAEAQAAIARTNLQRNRELAGQNFVSQSAVDQTEAALKVAEAQVALARAQVQRMRIVAPFDGVAGIRSVNLGDYVKDGADLVGVEDLSSVWVDFRLPERYAAKLAKSQPVELSLDALPGRRLAGKVEALDSQVDANGRSLLVRAQVTNPGGALRTGMFARVRVVFNVRDDATMVPEEALVPLAGKQFVFRVVDAGDGKRAQRLEARLGLRQPGKVEIVDGLKPGDLVVTAGHQRLLRGDSQPVRVVDLSAGPRGGAPGRAPGASAPASGGGGNGPPGGDRGAGRPV
ncbi:efflux RND transporter periplasmic adaptor subunit [Aquabacterium sp. J223]|uniref:efflux RND transporter periplasmic adaptor subunit n=1 Tax=Aquabacterium sp. J223 TaxID=2898431 RepID=UPI0021ADDF27|nr:efflux RND transporter periplasmic adaptor subunit [Aquabacterium sp. J223]UUX97741.1 efflux RND transporter periplasmic adaptor subunit [Aquabacterium sp. J223]